MTDCVFCDFSKIKERTIATIEGFNIVATFGQITNGGYLLLIPSRHIPCLGDLKAEEITIFENILSQTIVFLEEEYQNGVTLFEHGIVGQTVKHAHLHLIPSKIKFHKNIVSDFPHSEMQSISSFTQLSSLFKKRQEPYLLWSTSNNYYQICWNPPAVPEYLRTLSAQTLGVPERGSWRNMDPKLDKELIDQTMTRMFPFF